VVIRGFDRLGVDRMSKRKSIASGRKPGQGQQTGDLAALQQKQMLYARSSRPGPVERASRSSDREVIGAYMVRHKITCFEMRQVLRVFALGAIALGFWLKRDSDDRHA